MLLWSQTKAALLRVQDYQIKLKRMTEDVETSQNIAAASCDRARSALGAEEDPSGTQEDDSANV